ncbi:PREDICTED: uncharacterized protein LOC109217484 [Nicotiana attenuata]|uniref:uncharacterized protein LOC109217484 n=1 Tax=Nicotiana attenuata TaxID=49451 RepID=UPI000905ADE9|nr:PREDICTED: uncharacterized protein LOC109217484 [Nicotiana attenuata]
MPIGEETATGTSTGTAVDHHYPLYLQPCDTPGFVDGRCTKDKFDRSLHELWEKCNAIVFSWIMNAGISSVSAYFSKLTNLWEEYDTLMPCPGCDCPESKNYFEHFEYQRLLQFLMGINETYSQPRSQILMMSPVSTVNKAYSMIVSEESQGALGKFSQAVDIADGTTLFTNKEMNSRNNYKPRRGNMFCDYCNYKGHTRDTCFKLHGYSVDFKMRKKEIGFPQATSFPQRPMPNATTQEGQQSMTKQMTNVASQEGQ